jgi:hypothetical protein
MFARMLTGIFEALFYPLYLLMLGIDEISGEGRWDRQHRRRMELDRPPLPDVEFIRSVPVIHGEGPLWLAVRRAVTEPTDLPAEAIYPQERIADLWRMQWEGLDVIDLVYRLERILAIKITCPVIEQFPESIRSGRKGELREFAAAVVRSPGEATGPTRQVSAQLAAAADPASRVSRKR